jgi:hypothetical protein
VPSQPRSPLLNLQRAFQCLMQFMGTPSHNRRMPVAQDILDVAPKINDPHVCWLQFFICRTLQRAVNFGTQALWPLSCQKHPQTHALPCQGCIILFSMVASSTGVLELQERFLVCAIPPWGNVVCCLTRTQLCFLASAFVFCSAFAISFPCL